MSTKIYNAYKFNGKTPQLINILKDIRIKYQIDQMDKLIRFKDYVFKKEYFKFLDNDYTMVDLMNHYLGDLLLSDILEREMQICHNTPINISSSSVVYFYDNDIYIQFFGLDEKYLQDYKDLLIDFHYQNQTDMSNYNWYEEDWQNMTEERQKELENDWNNRKNIWENIITNNDNFSESGLIFNFHPVDYKLTMFCNDLLNKIKNNIYETIN